MSRSIIGVEITEECARAVEVTTGRTPQIVASGEAPLPAEAAHDSEVLDPGAVALAIRQLWSTAKFRSRNVTLGVASRRILVREYTTTAMKPDLLRKALPFQVQDLLPVPVSQAVLDYYPISQTGDQVHGLLVAAVSETIEQIIATFARAKVRISDVDLTAFGLARATAALVPTGTGAIVYAGDHTTQVVVTRDGVPDFVRIVPVDLATPAVRRRQIAPTEEDALDALLAGRPAQVPEAELVAAGVTPVRRSGLRASEAERPYGDFLARVRSTLSFYSNRPDAQPFDQVLLTGPGAVIDGVAESLAGSVEAPVRLVGATDLAVGRMPLPPGEHAHALVSTLGLVLGKDR
ncbi:type IV pilus biogenesis protein PilM [Microbacterium terrisoli]|uniref:type IV pilus biogenesis protein PilM n=1 Tax=Microbacterium terrisoli TaxID=3242192 RepID=UPI002804852B|nr:pilus assembly protein PilM [Microbacterium protaetiae]